MHLDNVFDGVSRIPEIFQLQFICYLFGQDREIDKSKK